MQSLKHVYKSVQSSLGLYLMSLYNIHGPDTEPMKSEESGQIASVCIHSEALLFAHSLSIHLHVVLVP